MKNIDIINRKILMVEDEIITAKTQKKSLEDYGYSVFAVKSGEEALEIFSQNNFDIVLLDIELGSGIDGAETARKILAQREIPVIFLSSHTDSSIVKRIEGIDSYGYVVKNTGIYVLDATIKMALKLFEAKKEIKDNQARLQFSEKMFHSLFEGMTSGCAIYRVINDGSKGSDYIVENFNKTSLGIEGKTLDEVKGKSLKDLRPQIDDFGLISEMQKVYVSGKPRFFPAKVYKDKSFFAYYENYIFKLPTGEVVTIYNDVTEQKRDELIKNIQYNIATSIVNITDPKELFEVVRCNVSTLIDTSNFYIALYDKKTDMLSITYEKDLKDAIECWKAENSMSSLVIKNRKPVLADKNYIIDLINKNIITVIGSLCESWIGVPIEIKGDIVGLIVLQSYDSPLAYDEHSIKVLELVASQLSVFFEHKRINESREKLQSQLNQSQKMESVGRLASGVAHDFNNLLSVILGYSELAMEFLQPDDPVYNNINEIYKAANKSIELTKQLLAFARKQPADPRIINLNKEITAMTNMLKRMIGEDIDLKCICDSKIKKIKIDPTQIDQILANLCVNARDAIEDTGYITIKTANVSFDSEFCLENLSYLPGEYVMLSISDTGSGMSQATKDKLFEPFFTTKEKGKGTGLGLSTVYGIVTQNNGFIIVESEIKKGSTFNIYLPVYNESDTIDKEKESKEIKTGSANILMVEDESAILSIGQAMLERLGYNVTTTLDPLEALSLIQNKDNKFDLLLTDLIMPKMNGKVLAEKALELCPDISIVFMTGYASDKLDSIIMIDPNVEKSKFSDILSKVHILQKPFSIADMSECVLNSLK